MTQIELTPKKTFIDWMRSAGMTDAIDGFDLEIVGYPLRGYLDNAWVITGWRITFRVSEICAGMISTGLKPMIDFCDYVNGDREDFVILPGDSDLADMPWPASPMTLYWSISIPSDRASELFEDLQK